MRFKLLLCFLSHAWLVDKWVENAYLGAGLMLMGFGLAVATLMVLDNHELKANQTVFTLGFDKSFNVKVKSQQELIEITKAVRPGPMNFKGDSK